MMRPRSPLGGATSTIVTVQQPPTLGTDGKWHHRVEWHVPCAAICNYTYKVRCIVNGEIFEGAQKSMRVGTCADIIEL